MRDSDFTPDIGAVVNVLQQREDREKQLDVMLKAIESELIALLGDETTPEPEWRHSVAQPLDSLAMVMRDVGTPTRTVENLAAQLSA